MANLNLNGNVSKNEEILNSAYTDLITFGKLFSPQDFLASATPQFHHKVGKLLLDKNIQQLALVLPRDHAKSTLASTAVLHRFLFATKEAPEFIAWIGEAQDQAIDNLNWIMTHIYENPAIHYVTYKAILDDGTPLWPSRWPLKKLEERKQFYIDSGTPAKFYQEYMNQAKSPEDQIFSEEDINEGYYKGNARFDESSDSWYIQLDDDTKKYINIYIGVDPASTINTYSDFSVIMVIGVTAEFDYYVLEYWRKRVLPMECADEIFKIFKRYSPVRRVNIETIAYQEMLRDYVYKRSKKEGLFIPGIEKGIKGYGNKKKKDRLFEGLQPMFKQGAVHLRKNHHEFIGELLDFPKGSHDDCIDAFWLSTQFARGNPKAGNEKKEKNKDGSYTYKRKIYNWMTGKRV
jgi:predicted phage terminase large subunit-like protein